MGCKPTVDYRKFRFWKLNTPEYSHLKYLAFWPIWASAFYFLEAIWIRDNYCSISCEWDQWIPFCEYFIVPYLFWFLFMLGTHLYSLLFDIEAFRKMMKFIVVNYTLTLVVFVIFPNCQELRPTVFERDNLFTAWTKAFHAFDTNTNVCPSLHVIGSTAAMLCGWDSRHFSSPRWKAAFGITAISISISTVFVKQHSIIDVFAAIPVCILAWRFAYHNPGTRRLEQSPSKNDCRQSGISLSAQESMCKNSKRQTDRQR